MEKLTTLNLIENELEGATANLRADYRELVAAARALADRLTRLAAGIEHDGGKTYIINSLGEVQGQGGNIDRLCALVCAGRDRAKSLDRMVRQGAVIDGKAVRS